jgi:hypothetical protein
MAEYLKTADVWTVLDLIVAEFESDPMSVQCFDLRLVERAKELNRAHQRGQDAAPELLDAARHAFVLLERIGERVNIGERTRDYHEERNALRAAIAKAEGR